MGGIGQIDQGDAMVAAVTEALGDARPHAHDFALAVGSVDRRLARPLVQARLVMNPSGE